MDFYKSRRQLMAELERISMKMKGESINIDSFSLEIARNFGFGNRIIMNVLKQYESAGKIKIIGDEFLVIDSFKKTGENSQKTEEKSQKTGKN